MRAIFLASAALLMTAGLAAAQSTASTSSPAPTGSVASPQVTPSGASPGTMAPAGPGSGSMRMSGAPAMRNGAGSPAPNGAVSAPSVTAAGASPGKMSPDSGSAPAYGGATASSAASAGETAGNPAPMHRHHWSGAAMALPADASASAYLHIAKSAIRDHNVSLADEALSHAETRLLDRAVPQGDITADDSPSIQSIESARQALQAGNYTQASVDTKQAASAVSGM